MCGKIGAAPTKAELALVKAMGTTINVTASGDDAMSGVAQYIFEVRPKALPGEEWNDSTWENRDVKESTAKTYSYGYENLTPGVTYELRVTVVDAAGNSLEGYLDAMIQGATITLADAGKKVNYTPKAGQTYSTTQNGTEYSGNSKQDFSTSDLTGTWSLWGVDDKNVYVIADNATTKKLTLTGVRGYNNGVTLLDNICDTCFTDKDTYPNMSGRNLKLEDVLDVKSASATNGNGNYGKTPYSYSFIYPYIWNHYEKTQANSTANRSTAYPLTTQDALTSNITYSPYSTVWCYDWSWNSASYWTNTAYHRMVMTPAQTHVYWLSSRYVRPNDSSYCYFGLQYVHSSGVNAYHLYRYNSGSPRSNSTSIAVRPLVSFPLSSHVILENGDTYDILPMP